MRKGKARRVDHARVAALETMNNVTIDGAFAHIALDQVTPNLSTQDAGFATELVNGTARMMGSYDSVIREASGRDLASLQPQLVNVLRLACHQLFSMRVPTHAAVDASVNLAGVGVSERVTGLVNAVTRKLARHSWDEWVTMICPEAGLDQIALRYGHPRWIVDVLAQALASTDEIEALLSAHNTPATPTLVIRPGLASIDELIEAGATPTTWSPWGATRPGNPADVPAIRQGRAGVQDEGSQLVTQAGLHFAQPGAWLDLCAGPGGKSALLAAHAPGLFIANEVSHHRAVLVRKGLRAFDQTPIQVIQADGVNAPWRDGSFSFVLADVPCSGLGSLRRRAESRWRKTPDDVSELVDLQRVLLQSAISAAQPGGIITYITCSPHVAETTEIIQRASGIEILDAPSALQVPASACRIDARCIQLWPHIHGTDAMFAAVLRKLG